MEISTKSIFKTIERKNERKIETFKAIMKKCIAFIEKNVKVNNYTCFYQVPDFVVGHSMYSIEECIIYLQNELRKNGFVVSYFFPNILYISWDEKEIKEENPGMKSKKETKLLEHVEMKSSGKFVLNL